MRRNDLLIKNIGWLGTMDGENRLLRGGYILIKGGFISSLGTGEIPAWDGPVLDAGGGIALPGLINLHHHLYQNLARAYSPVCNLSLLPWVREMNKLWDGFTVDDLVVATRTGLVELMLSGCTTVLDHHYVFPQGGGDMIAGQFAVAGELGIRFIAGRGSFDTGDNLMPPWAVESTDRILEDCERLIQTYHDREPGSYRQIALAPTGPLVVSPRLLRESAAMAIRHQAVITTHNCESADELPWAMEKVGCTPFEHLLECGWGDGRTVLAHSIQMDDTAVALAGRHRIGVAHCPCSNMRLGSGICRVQDLRKAGAHVGLGVDGSASNDSGHLLNEARQCLYLSRV
ncbi:MAG TPA: amidohydrolase family protein, partial [Oceanipulchritudo sp.]|nr:amidohydrolase family protein [Oceanipulchritudo sp.]